MTYICWKWLVATKKTLDELCEHEKLVSEIRKSYIVRFCQMLLDHLITLNANLTPKCPQNQNLPFHKGTNQLLIWALLSIFEPGFHFIWWCFVISSL